MVEKPGRYGFVTIEMEDKKISENHKKSTKNEKRKKIAIGAGAVVPSALYVTKIVIRKKLREIWENEYPY